MAKITATVEKIDELESKEGNTYWKVHLKGKEYSAFDGEVLGELQEGDYITADVGEQKKGQYTNRYFNSWEEAGGAGNGRGTAPKRRTETAPQVAPASVPVSAEVWEAKDRRIALESAYSTAARFYQGRMGEPIDLARLARAIYRDIQYAGQGQPFPKLKEAEQPREVQPSPESPFPFNNDVPF